MKDKLGISAMLLAILVAAGGASLGAFASISAGVLFLIGFIVYIIPG